MGRFGRAVLLVLVGGSCLVARVQSASAAVPKGGLQICNVTNDPALPGTRFSFTENGGRTIHVAAGTPAAPVCSRVRPYRLGTEVDVAELFTIKFVVTDSIVVSDHRGSDVNLADGRVTALVGPGVTVVTFTNNDHCCTQTGFVAVCVSAGDPGVEGSFDFTISSPAFHSEATVSVGECSPPTEAEVGDTTITEAARAPYGVAGIVVTPANRAATKNRAKRTATVLVVPGDASSSTVVTFVESTSST